MVKKSKPEPESKPEILILGAAGQVGCELVRRLPPERVVARAKEALDVCNVEKVREVIESLQPKIVINLASTNPNKYQTTSADNWMTNAWAVSNLVKTCALNGSALIHLSTADVFGGDQLSVPYKELDPISPRTDFAQSKAGGEHAILSVAQYPVAEFVNFRYWILRTANVYERPTRFYHNLLQLHLTRVIRSREKILLPDDVTVSTMYVPALVEQIAWLVENYESAPVGIYHLANQGSCSLYELINFALGYCLTKVSGHNIAGCSRTEYHRVHGGPLLPANQAIDCHSWDKIAPIPLPHWRDSITEFARSYRSQSSL